jgi:hypothetical protein
MKLSSDLVPSNSIDKAKLFCKTKVLEKSKLYQTMSKPPDLPSDVRKIKESNLLGQIFLMKAKSKDSFFVSWKQIMVDPLSSILFMIIGHLIGSLVPLMFQFRIFHMMRFMDENY